MNDGINNANNAILYAEDDHISLLDPTRLGYTFEGWYLDESFKNPVSSITTFDHSTLNVYAKWVCNIFYYEINDNKAIVTGYDKSYGITDLEIPSEYNGYIVTGIMNGAFSNCKDITSVTIPNGVTEIGPFAFYNCTGLTRVSITNIESWCNIPFSSFNDNPLYYAHNLYLNDELVTNIIIPDGVTSISNYAFSGCTSITSIIIPDSVTSIGGYAFYWCRGLTSVTIGNSVTSIGQAAFSGCYRLVEVVNKSSLQLTLGSYDNGWISYFAKQIITEEADSKLSTTNDGLVLYTDNDNVYLVSYVGNNTEIVIPNNVTKINDYAFYDCKDLTSITIPNNVTCIGVEAFSNCTSLTSITIGNSVTSIGEWAFSNCPSLTGIVVSENNPKYDSRNSCNAIIETSSNMLVVGCANTVIPDSVTSIGYYAFYNCAGLTNITIPDNVTKIVKFAFYGCKDLESVTIGNGITSIGEAAFSECSSLENITISNSVKSIESFAFSNCTSLTSITIPDSITSIVDSAFYGCTSLANITIPDSVTSIGYGSFDNCRSLASITIPNSVTSIGERAFYDCYKLTSVTIGNSVTSIGSDAFSGCYRLVEVVNKSSLQLTLGSEDNGYIAYYARQIIINEADSKLTITNDGFALYTDNTDVYLLVYLGNGTEIVLPNNVTIINDRAFSECKSLTSVTLQEGVTIIGNYAFEYCYDLVSIVIPEGITTIGDYVFAGCSKIESIIIPNSITSIGSDAFNNCGIMIIYYCGTASQYNSLSNKPRRMTAYYYSESKPVDAGNYWHYVDGTPVIWQ